MTYDQVYQIISLYAPSVLHLFADGWSRWPTQGAADTIVWELNRQLDFWSGRGENVAASLFDAINEIERRAEC